MSVFDNVAYWFYHTNSIPLYVFSEYTLQEIVKDPYDEQIFLIELERLKDFIANYKQLKEKHPVIIKGIDE